MYGTHANMLKIGRVSAFEMTFLTRFPDWNLLENNIREIEFEFSALVFWEMSNILNCS